MSDTHKSEAIEVKPLGDQAGDIKTIAQSREERQREKIQKLRQKAREGCEHFDAKGMAFTYEDIRKYVGGGTYSDISGVVKDYRREVKLRQLAPINVPADLQNMGNRLIQEFWARSDSEANIKVEAIAEKARQDKEQDDDLIIAGQRANEKLTQKNEELLEERAELRVEVGHLREFKNKASSQIGILEERNAGAVEKHDILQQRFNDLVKSSQGERERLEDRISDLAGQLEESEGSLKVVRENYEIVKDSRQAVEQRVVDLQAKLSNSQTEKNSLSERFADLEETHRNTLTVTEQQREQISGLQLSLSQTTAEVKELTGKSQEAAEQASREKADLMGEITVLEKQKASTETELKVLKNNQIQAAARDRQKDQQIKGLNRQIKELNQRVNQLVDQLGTVMADTLVGTDDPKKS